jgi:hypothetical protein
VTSMARLCCVLLKRQLGFKEREESGFDQESGISTAIRGKLFQIAGRIRFAIRPDVSVVV